MGLVSSVSSKVIHTIKSSTTQNIHIRDVDQTLVQILQ